MHLYKKESNVKINTRSTRRLVVTGAIEVIAMMAFLLLARSPRLDQWAKGPVSDWCRYGLLWLVDLGHDAWAGLPHAALMAAEGTVKLTVACVLGVVVWWAVDATKARVRRATSR
jgi:hypothetical protein